MMAMRLPRFRLRTLMIVVAVVGAMCAGSITLRRRSTSFNARAQRHIVLQLLSKTPYSERYHQDMVNKYLHASRYAWLPVPPDPPEPK